MKINILLINTNLFISYDIIMMSIPMSISYGTIMKSILMYPYHRIQQWCQYWCVGLHVIRYSNDVTLMCPYHQIPQWCQYWCVHVIGYRYDVKLSILICQYHRIQRWCRTSLDSTTCLQYNFILHNYIIKRVFMYFLFFQYAYGTQVTCNIWKIKLMFLS